MLSIGDMSYIELKEQIENCIDELDQCEFGTGDYNTWNAALIVAKNELKVKREIIHRQIIKDITNPKTMCLEEANYVSYLEFLSDAEMGSKEYSEVLFEDFEEEELARLWKESH
jgi:hypothetical protein